MWSLAIYVLSPILLEFTLCVWTAHSSGVRSLAKDYGQPAARLTWTEPIGIAGIDLDSTIWDFEGAVAQLPQGSPESAGNGEQHSPRADLPQLSKDARELLVEAVKDKGRMIRKVRTMGGLSISAGSKSFGEMGNARSEARWEQAIQDLLDQELVVDPIGKGRVFEVTHTKVLKSPTHYGLQSNTLVKS